MGDLWLLGNHRLLCADATKAESFDSLLKAEKAQMVFVDPPYNVRIDGNVCGLGAIKHREFQMAAGEMSEVELHRGLPRGMGPDARVHVEAARRAMHERRRCRLSGRAALDL